MKQLKGLCMLNLFVIISCEVGIRTRPLSGLFLSHLYQVCWADVELAILSLSTHQSHALLNHVSLWNVLNSRVVKTFQPHVPASGTHLLTCLPTLHRSTLLWKLACCSKAPPTQIRPFPGSTIQSTNHDLRLNHC